LSTPGIPVFIAFDINPNWLFALKFQHKMKHDILRLSFGYAVNFSEFVYSQHKKNNKNIEANKIARD